MDFGEGTWIARGWAVRCNMMALLKGMGTVEGRRACKSKDSSSFVYCESSEVRDQHSAADPATPT
jgi:hypothetical protein